MTATAVFGGAASRGGAAVAQQLAQLPAVFLVAQQFLSSFLVKTELESVLFGVQLCPSWAASWKMLESMARTAAIGIIDSWAECSRNPEDFFLIGRPLKKMQAGT